MLRILVAAMAGVAALMPCLADETAELSTSCVGEKARVTLFDRGDMGSTFWRIPALAVTDKGTVVAVADKRNTSNRDLPNAIDLAVRRSTDNGLTWSEPQIVVMANEDGGYGDAALGFHHPTGELVIVCVHGNGIWESTPDNHSHLVVMRSSDEGATWSEPLDITEQLFDWADGAAPIKALSGFASSGELLCDADGRLMFVLVANPTQQMWGPLHCYVCTSEDGGYTWATSPYAVDDFGDESKIAQLADKSYYLSVRNRHKGARRICRSTDGVHWTAPRNERQLIDPACNGDLLTLSPAQVEALGLAPLLTNGGKQGLLLHSLANDPKERRDVSVLASADLGLTWQKLCTVHPCGSSYSAMALLPDGDLGVFSEENHPEGGFRLVFVKVNLAECLQALQQ